MDIRLENSWKEALAEEFAKAYFTALASKIRAEYQTGPVYPAPAHIFRALDQTPFNQVRVVILGQDPYHGPGQAQGLSFSVPACLAIPPSLQNIFKEMVSDLGGQLPVSGDLSYLSAQGVLLLNATLTVRANTPGSHQKLGWEQFTDAIIKKLSADREHLVFLLWGNFAKQKATLIDSTKHLILTAPHPSPFSAYSGFFGCRHFSKTNAQLATWGLETIEWLPPVVKK
jgi:uracil-DNA glycosylase